MKIARYVPAFFLLAGIVLIPWTIWLTFSLPMRHESDNWRTVWTGFDAAEATMLIATAVAALRRSPWLPVVSAIAGTLLCVDAWFDITLEAGGQHLLAAVLEATFVELPLAGICFWVSRNAEHTLLQSLPPWRRAALRALAEPPQGSD
jgi:hypothetical protein